MRPTVADLLVALAVAELGAARPCGCCSRRCRSRSPTARSSSCPGRSGRRRSGRSRCSRCSSGGRCSSCEPSAFHQPPAIVPGGQTLCAGHRAAELGVAVAAQRAARAVLTAARAQRGVRGTGPEEVVLRHDRERAADERGLLQEAAPASVPRDAEELRPPARRVVWLTRAASARLEAAQLRAGAVEREEREVGRGGDEQEERQAEQLLVGEHVADPAAGPERDRGRRHDRADVQDDVHDARRGVDLAEAAARPDRDVADQRDHHERGEQRGTRARRARPAPGAPVTIAATPIDDLDRAADAHRRPAGPGARPGAARPPSSPGRTALSAPATVSSSAATRNGPAQAPICGKSIRRSAARSAPSRGPRSRAATSGARRRRAARARRRGRTRGRPPGRSVW